MRWYIQRPEASFLGVAFRSLGMHTSVVADSPQGMIVCTKSPPPPLTSPPLTAQVSAGVGKPPHGLGVCIWMHLVNGTGNSPSPGRPTPGVVQQHKSSGGSVDTTKTRSGPQRVRMSSGERPIGAAKGKQPNTEALCQPPPPYLPPYRAPPLYPPTTSGIPPPPSSTRGSSRNRNMPAYPDPTAAEPKPKAAP